MNAPRQALLQLNDVLAEQASGLMRLGALAAEQRQALIASDYDAVRRTVQAMETETNALRALDERREQLLAGLGMPAARLDDVVAEAASMGVPAFGETRERLEEAVRSLGAAQETNATIILSASRLIERWVTAIAGLAGLTYGAEGKANRDQARRFMSRTV